MDNLDNLIPELSLSHIPALHSLIRLASSPAMSNRATRVVNEAMAALDVQACVFQRLRESGDCELLASRYQKGLDSALLERLAASLFAEVVSGGKALVHNDLTRLYPNEPAVAAGVVTRYAGVPLFGPHGAVCGVAALFAAAERAFDDFDVWWMETAAHLASGAIACESLEECLNALEQEHSLRPSQGSQGPRGRGAAGVRDASSERVAVLVVDDDPAVNKLIHKYLTRQGHVADSASGGLEALRLFQAGAYDVVITDMVMPGMNGWELVAALHSVDPHVPVIIITGYSGNQNGVWNRQYLRSQGIVAVINKPIDFNYLSSILGDIPVRRGRAA